MAQVVEDNCPVCGKPNSAHKALDILICGDEWRAREYLDAARKPPVLVHPLLLELVRGSFAQFTPMFSTLPNLTGGYVAHELGECLRRIMMENQSLWKPLP